MKNQKPTISFTMFHDKGGMHFSYNAVAIDAYFARQNKELLELCASRNSLIAAMKKYLGKRKTAERSEARARLDKEQYAADIVENSRLDSELDICVIGLFNALTCCNGGTFRIPASRGIVSARGIVSTWSPQLHGPIEDTPYVVRQYVLSKFFDRYISVEDANSGLITKLSDEATIAFLKTNKEGEELDFTPGINPVLDECLDWMTEHMSSTLGSINITKVFRNCKHGANGSTNIKKSDAYLDAKYLTIAGPRRSLDLFVHYTFWDFQLREYLMEHSSDFRSIANGVHWNSKLIQNATKQLFVPKSIKAVRGVCPELELPGFYGQGLAVEITRALRKVNIDFATQPTLHGGLAYWASLYPCMEIATLDFSEASNRIWVKLCKRVLKESWFAFANDYCRSEMVDVVIGCVSSDLNKRYDDVLLEHFQEYTQYGKLAIRDQSYGREIVVELKSTIFCTMGNPITFPLQTLIFHSFLTYCSLRALLDERVPDEDLFEAPWKYYVSSYGDDGILNAGALPKVRELAPMLGWKVNEEKTFGIGDDFRESCGSDFIHGVGCRPLRLKRPDALLNATPKETCKHFQAWLYQAANAALITCNDVLHGNPDGIYHWLEACHKRFNLGKICLVPSSLPSGAGLQVPWLGNYWELFFDSRLYNIPTVVESPPHLANWFHRDAKAEHEIEPVLPAYPVLKYFRMIYRPDKVGVGSEYPFFHHSLKGATDSLAFNDNYLGFDSAVLTVDNNGCVVSKVKGRTQKVSYYTLSWV